MPNRIATRPASPTSSSTECTSYETANIRALARAGWSSAPRAETANLALMPVDPKIADLPAEAEKIDPRPLEALSVAEARARGGSVNAAPALARETVAEVRDVIADTRPPIPVRLYRPRSGKPLPLLVYFHGGGWVVGSVAISDPFCRALANASGCAVLSVYYRLRRRARYPARA